MAVLSRVGECIKREAAANSVGAGCNRGSQLVADGAQRQTCRVRNHKRGTVSRTLETEAASLLVNAQADALRRMGSIATARTATVRRS